MVKKVSVLYTNCAGPHWPMYACFVCPNKKMLPRPWHSRHKAVHRIFVVSLFYAKRI